MSGLIQSRKRDSAQQAPAPAARGKTGLAPLPQVESARAAVRDALLQNPAIQRKKTAPSEEDDKRVQRKAKKDDDDKRVQRKAKKDDDDKRVQRKAKKDRKS